MRGHPTPRPLSEAAGRPSDARTWRVRRLAALLGAVILFAGLAGCGKDKPDSSTWPDGAGVIAAAADAISGVSSVHLVLDLDPALGNPAIKRADLDLTAAGDSKGEVELQVLGTAITTLQLVTLGPTAEKPGGASYVFMTGLGWIDYPTLTQTYDTKAILSRDRGVPKMLATATNAVTVDSEEIDGVDSWKVSVVFDIPTIEALVNSELGDSPIEGQVWIAKDTHYLTKAELHVPESPGVNKAALVTVKVTKVNEPVDIRAPVLG